MITTDSTKSEFIMSKDDVLAHHRRSKYLIGMTCGSDSGTDEAPYAIVEISEEDAKNILSWMHKFEKGGALASAASVQFHHGEATFVKNLNESFPGYDVKISDSTIVSFSDLLTHPDSLASESDDGPVLRTDFDMMSISGNNVSWQAALKYSDSEVESPSLSRAQIEEMIADFAKETP